VTLLSKNQTYCIAPEQIVRPTIIGIIYSMTGIIYSITGILYTSLFTILSKGQCCLKEYGIDLHELYRDSEICPTSGDWTGLDYGPWKKDGTELISSRPLECIEESLQCRLPICLRSVRTQEHADIQVNWSITK
jgi:hypothetical protein